jgi:CheY-like chemotaxis protein
VSNNYLNDALEVTVRTLNMMFQITATPTQHKLEDSQISPFEISGVIGITGSVTGCLVVSFPDKIAREITSRTFKELSPDQVTEEDIVDCVGEVANIVGGNLLRVLGDKDGSLHLSLPGVVMGTHRVVWRRKDTPYDLVILNTEFGQFGVGVNLRVEPAMETKPDKPFKFLLVDDSRVTRRLMKNALKEADVGECEYFEAADGQEALDELEKMNYGIDLVFCDINMPNMDGLEFLKHLTDRGKLEACPVIMVTGDLSEGTGAQTLENGAKDLVGKPFTAETIRASIEKVLGAVR